MPAEAAALLDGLYEHSPWIAEAALAQRPFRSLAHLKHAHGAGRGAGDRASAQLGLIRAHPELAGKAMVSKTLTAESTNEQSKAGLTQLHARGIRAHPAAQRRLQRASSASRSSWPCAARAARACPSSEIIDTFARRLHHPPDFERAEALRNIHRIAEIRLNDKFGVRARAGQRRLGLAGAPGAAQRPGLRRKGPAHRHLPHRRAPRLRRSASRTGCATAASTRCEIDAVGNVVGRYHGATPDAKALLTGSHYDTVRNGGKYDGRLGIFVPMACVRELHRQGRRLPFGIEVVGFAEEEGQRYKATFLGSGALIGHFNPDWLDQKDADGITMREAMQHAGLSIDDIPKLQRDPARYLGFVEVHIEQGPVLNELDLPLGIVTSINGGVRYVGEMIGMASHAGTTPMDRRRDAAAAVAELALYAEQRAAQDGDSVATIGMLQVPNGSINVVPGRCQFTLDMRAPNDPQRDALVGRRAGRARRPSASAAACATRSRRRCAPPPRRARPAWQQRWETRRRGARRAAVPHAQRRRPRRHEAARSHAAGHAVRARPATPASATTRSKHHQRRHAAGRAMPSSTLLDQLATETP